MNYWLDLFTGTTWTEFRAAGAKITGFRHRMRKAVSRLQPGDILVCYLTGVMRFVGALEVVKPSDDKTSIWNESDFPERLEVKPLVLLDPQYGIPMSELEGKTAFYRNRADSGKFKGFLRMSPNRFTNPADGELVLKLLRAAEKSPVSRAVDPKKLARRYLYEANRKKGKASVPTVVSVPEPEEDESESSAGAELPITGTKHTEIQFHLLRLGANIGYRVWVARNDRSKTWDGTVLSEIPELVSELPTQFNEATNRTIELIDVLWLRGNSIVAAFEIESTTSVYSGLLRMSDLLALQPNLEINLYLVAPDERRDKVQQEILRPTFALRDKPLPKVCGFIGFSNLLRTVEGVRKLGLEKALKPEFLDAICEYFEEADVEQ